MLKKTKGKRDVLKLRDEKREMRKEVSQILHLCFFAPLREIVKGKRAFFLSTNGQPPTVNKRLSTVISPLPSKTPGR